MSYDQLKTTNFEQDALACYRYQLASNSVYRSYCYHIGHNKPLAQTIEQIPFLPISLFKTHEVFKHPVEKIFYSSGTSNQQLSKHGIKDLKLYEFSFMEAFQQFYGAPENYIILALLPGYLEREGSSLVYMVSKLIEATGNELSGFYLNDFEALNKNLITAMEQEGKIPLLIGVAFALLDFCEAYPIPLKNTIVMETGGMKGNRPELTRLALHERLQKAFDLKEIHSEYGMTELLSQGYAKQAGIFESPNWMRALVRDPYDPFDVTTEGKGLLNIIDLANKHSCAFIATDDLGTVFNNGTFTVEGRSDFSEVRGCNLMYNPCK